MNDSSSTEALRVARLDRYRLLFVEEWRRQRITNVMMADRLGRSLSLTNKLKAGTTPLTGPIIDQFIKVLGLDPIRVMFAIDIALSHTSYYDPHFQSACTTAISFFETVVVEFGYRQGPDGFEAARKAQAAEVERAAREAASALTRTLGAALQPQFARAGTGR